MLRTDLIELVNSGQAWAFVGSGLSAEAGLPGWEQLVDGITGRLAGDTLTTVEATKSYGRGRQDQDWPRCLGAIEAVIGRPALEAHVREILAGAPRRPGRALDLVSDWPFAGYITTNYDSLIESALRPKTRGWVSVGNAADEIRKVSGGASNLIWHVHGSLEHPEPAGRLILTMKDYDDLYLEGSPLANQLRAFLQHHRVVFFGFSFKDAELQRLFKLTRQYCSPARPAFAFLRDAAENERIEMLDEFNVDTVPYPRADGSHRALVPTLEAYGSFVIKRTLKFGQPGRPVPSYDPETTGLMVFNALVLRRGVRIDHDVIQLLLRARVLSLLGHDQTRTDEDLIRDLEEKARLFSDADFKTAREGASEAVKTCLRELMSEGLVGAEAIQGGGRRVRLLPAGLDLVNEHAANAELLVQKFRASLRDRAIQIIGDAEPSCARVAGAAEAFLKECVERRAVGVAQALAQSGDIQQFHMVALLQALPQFMAQLEGDAEARALVRLVEDVLATRDGDELAYLGSALQARFGVHLLGLDPDALRARMDDLRRTLFLIDAVTLIHLLARSSGGWAAARLLMDRLHHLGAPVATTDKIATEVAEHARWARDHAKLDARGAMVASGRAGFRTNQFVQGFLAEVAAGQVAEFREYLESAVGTGAGSASDEAFRKAIARAGIPCLAFDEWHGFDEALWTDVEESEEELTRMRKAGNSYRHERQVRAEAEALVIVEAVRAGTLTLDGNELDTAFFMSPMRGIEDMAKGGTPAMRPGTVLQWINSLVPSTPDELAGLVDGLLAELADRGLAVVDRNQLRLAFHPAIEASKERLTEELASYHQLVTARWGQESLEALRDLDDLDLMVAEKPYYAMKAEELQAELDRERAARENAQETRRLTERERSRLQELDAAEKARRARTLAKQRKSADKGRRRRR